MQTRFTAAAIQTCAGKDKKANLDRAAQLAREAHASVKPLLIALPEVFFWRGRPDEEREAAEPLSGPTIARMAELARELGAWLLLGSFLEATRGDERPFNTSVLIDPAGQVASTYRKIHLFDVHVDGVGAVRESATRAPGDQAVVTPLALPGGGVAKLGLSVCYDLRFPELYRAHSAAGAQVLMVPAAFTARTGRDHWLALLRARAIENLCWVIAPNQFGTGGEGIETYGRSCIIDPWGTVVATAADAEGWTSAVIDLEQQRAIRERFPALSHRRPDVRAP